MVTFPLWEAVKKKSVLFVVWSKKEAALFSSKLWVYLWVFLGLLSQDSWVDHV